jgi:ATP-binding cassette subfamily F protein 3
LKQRLTAAESEMEQAQHALARIDAALADPALFTRDPTRGASLSRERADAAGALERAEADWLEASTALEK